MRTNGLQPRAIGALSVVAASLFLLLCLANYGQGGFETAGEAPWHLGVAGWFVEVFGAGAFALVLLPLVWGLVVYFREDTPSLSMRAAGTLLLACSISMIAGLVQQQSLEMAWAGAVGEYTVALSGGLGGVIGNGLALALAWAAALTLFMASLVWATDWWFHSLRKGPVVPVLATRGQIETEPTRVELFDDVEDEPDLGAEREYVSMATAGASAVDSLHVQSPSSDEVFAADDVPSGFSSRPSGDRVVVQGPVGYEGVEFLPASDELAAPREPEERLLNDEELVLEHVLDDEYELTGQAEEPAETLSRAAEEPGTQPLFGEEPADEAPAPAASPESPPPIATVEQTLGRPVYVSGDVVLADDVFIDGVPVDDTAAAAESVLPELLEEETPAPVEIEDEAATAVDSALAPETDAEPVADVRRSGIGIPEDSPFVDEFFSVDVLVDEEYAVESFGEGASADGEVEATFGTTIPTAPAAEDAPASAPHEPAPFPAPAPEPNPDRAAPVIVDELLFADAYDIVDDELPAPIAARSAAEPAPPPAVDAEGVDAEGVDAEGVDAEGVDAEGVDAEAGDAEAGETEAAGTQTGLERIPTMQLDPLFHDAVEVVIEAGRGSAMSLQRRFGIGHGRGLRLLEQMQEAGILEAEDASGTREVRVTRAEWEAFSRSTAS